MLNNIPMYATWGTTSVHKHFFKNLILTQLLINFSCICMDLWIPLLTSEHNLFLPLFMSKLKILPVWAVTVLSIHVLFIYLIVWAHFHFWAHQDTHLIFSLPQNWISPRNFSSVHWKMVFKIQGLGMRCVHSYPGVDASGTIRGHTFAHTHIHTPHLLKKKKNKSSSRYWIPPVCTYTPIFS
jgi:hypothetical protein